MSTFRIYLPAGAAGLLTVCFAAAVAAQNAGPGAPNPNNTSGSTATTSQSPASPAARSDAMRSPAAQRATSGDTSNGSMAMGSNNATAKATTVSSGDRKFIEKAAQGGLAEVQLGKLAADKASAAEVKQFGQRMVDDHGKANDQLKALATSKGVNVSTELDRSTRREMDKLSKLSGAAFDREYMKHMVADHKKDVSEFKSEAKRAKDADVRQFAASTLPTLEQHLSLAQETQKAADNAPRTAGKTSSTAPRKTGT